MLSQILELPSGANLEEYLSEDDIDCITDKVSLFYKDRISYLAYTVYGDNDLGKKSFFEVAKLTLKEALRVFLFEKQHWRSNRDINPYILAALKYKARSLKNHADALKFRSVMICPGCKSYGEKEFLIESGKDLVCVECKERLEDPEISYSEKRIREAFANHSTTGYCCSECDQFLPKSIVKGNQITCVYNDCMFTGSVSELEIKYHPRSQKIQNNISINKPVSDDADCNTSIQDLKPSDVINADVVMEVGDTIGDEFKLLKSVMQDQIDLIKKINSPATMLQKLLMYQAYFDTLTKYPRETFAYLVHRKCIADHSIQASVFQEYVRLIEDYLPCTVVASGKTHEIVSLTDPMLLLFSGMSEFNTTVRYDGSIPNETKEHYVGSRNLKDYGPHFFGKIISITGLDGTSFINHVERHDFNTIYTNIKPGTSVTVKHYGMPSHYEIGALAYLQRIRKKIVDKVFLKLNGTKREVGQ